MAHRDVDIVDPAAAPDTEPLDPALVWWLVKLAKDNRELYRRVRAFAWGIVIENSARSEIPNNLS